MAWAELTDVRCYYEILGQGEPLLLVPGLGVTCRVGWFERPERLLLLIVAGLFGVGPVMPGALILLAVLSFATAAQRVVYVWMHTRAAGRDS